MIAFYAVAGLVDILVLIVAHRLARGSGAKVGMAGVLKLFGLLMALSFPVTILAEAVRCWLNPTIHFSWGPWVVPFAWNGMLLLSPLHLAATVMWWLVQRDRVDSHS